ARRSPRAPPRRRRARKSSEKSRSRPAVCSQHSEVDSALYHLLSSPGFSLHPSEMPADFPAPPPDSLETLIQKCLGGDQRAWELIVRQHWRKVFNVAYKFVGRHDEAEDLVQDIFLKIFKSLDTFDRRANFQTWLVSVSRNLCIDHYRSVRKEREVVDRG